MLQADVLSGMGQDALFFRLGLQEEKKEEKRLPLAREGLARTRKEHTQMITEQFIF